MNVNPAVSPQGRRVHSPGMHMRCSSFSLNLLFDLHLVALPSWLLQATPDLTLNDCKYAMRYADIKPEPHSRGSSADATASSHQQQQQQHQQQQQQHQQHLPLIASQAFPLITSIPAPVSLSTNFTSPPATLDPVSSASLRLGQVPSLQLNGQGSDASGGAMGGIMDKDALAKAEVRRARRCVQYCIVLHARSAGKP